MVSGPFGKPGVVGGIGASSSRLSPSRRRVTGPLPEKRSGPVAGVLATKAAWPPPRPAWSGTTGGRAWWGGVAGEVGGAGRARAAAGRAAPAAAAQVGGEDQGVAGGVHLGHVGVARSAGVDPLHRVDRPEGLAGRSVGDVDVAGSVQRD